MKEPIMTIKEIAVIFAVVIAITGTAAIFLVRCEGQKDDAMLASGLLGEHPLARMERLGAISSDISGSFYFGIGTIGGGGAEPTMQFYWSPKPKELLATTMPYSKFRIIIDETKTTPTAEFIFTSRWCEGALEKNRNLNNCIMNDVGLELIQIRIASTTLEKEVYLPKIR